MLGDLTNDNRFRMRSTSVLLIILVAEALAAPQPQSPGDDGDHESIKYETVKEYEGYEERKYPSVKFVCTELTYNIYEHSQEESYMFYRLFSYISGVNSENQTIEMTIPVISKLAPKEYYHITKEICFYLPSKFQDNPPKPTDKAVIIKKSNERVVFVKKVWGYAMTTDYVLMDTAASFFRELEIAKRAEEIINGYFYTAGYDSRGTRYEVMVEKLQVASDESKPSIPMPLLLSQEM